jgi:hypothetical protein
MWGRARRAAFAAMLLATVEALSPLARAQDAPSGAADLVTLKNGSRYRGMILEFVPGDHVDLRLPSGEVKRFAMVEVAYAGEAADEPHAGPQPEPGAPRRLLKVDIDEARVHFESFPADTDFHIRTGGPHSYERICSAPCDANLPTGKQRLALALKGRAPVEPDDAVAIEGASRVTGTYVDNHGTRVAGWIFFGLSIGTGTALMALAFANPAPDSGPNTALFGSAVLVIGGGVTFGLILALHHDRVTLEVTPMNAGLRLPPLMHRESAWFGAESAVSPGLGLRLRF